MNKLKKWIAISLLISLISGALVIALTFDASTLEAIVQIKTEYIILAVLLHIFSLFMQGIRIKTMCGALGYDIGIKEATKIVTSSMFVAAITPAAVAGEPLRVHLLNRRSIPLGKATAVILGERLMDALLIISLVPLSLYVMRGFLTSAGANTSIDTALMIGEIVLLCLFSILIYGLWKPKKTRKVMYFLVHRFSRLFGKGTETMLPCVLERVDTELEHLHDSVAIFIKDGRKGLFLGMGCTVIVWALDFAVLPVLLVGLNQQFQPLVAYASQVILMVIMVVSITPGAGGVAELGASTLFSFFVGSSLIGIVVVAWRAITFYMNLAVGGFVSLKIIKDTDYIKRMFK
ncbi:MAG: hypothetical protein A4E24_01373 [Methanomethylovorans sp. PtaU1.Bin093]|jgi:uncharacterized protein (TIRG00374 family)|uniref:lysylphosphatidylglycerol synthase transmembrane domain-containing protein n=1 Tax=Methanomethylovorans sp. PtaU1.Bin093 TaxID=1811679 RepID=UPI0009CE5EE2|nr:flippase-like domain-containing protein [Methanomethylovorans sp. PtaU1.Bin093]OPY20095.1 MAG: hypothetical protein A4E24_01373 [Methanomethylovorans sp. PtaU1.Bin093]